MSTDETMCGTQALREYIAERRPKIIKNNVPPIICLCGSTKFIDKFDDAMLNLTLSGYIVLTVGSHLPRSREYADNKDGAKAGLDRLHKCKIDLCDAVYVVNEGGYIGPSTRGEIEYARLRGKPIFYDQTPLPDAPFV